MRILKTNVIQKIRNQGNRLENKYTKKTGVLVTNQFYNLFVEMTSENQRMTDMRVKERVSFKEVK